ACCQPCSCENGWKNVYDVVDLSAHRSGIGYDFRPRHDEAVACSTKMGGNLLVVLERRVDRPPPRCGKMVVCPRAADFIDLLQLVLESFVEAIRPRLFEQQAIESAF